jgi:glutamyl endopeptidase
MEGSIKASQKQMVFYKMDTFGGQSGSPVFQPNRASCGGPCAMAIHSYGVGGTGPGAKNNSRPRITAKRFDLITELAAQDD